MKIVVSYNASSIKNMNTLYKFAVKIRNIIFMQFQNMMITAMFFEMNWTDIVIQIVKNLIWFNFSSTRQDKNKLKKFD